MSSWDKTHDLHIAEPKLGRASVVPVYQTKLGTMYHGDSAAALRTRAFQQYKKKAQLIFTSPPFPLLTQKKYGNFAGKRYVDWFSDFAPLLTKFLKPDGSIVVEIGNAWEQGRPVMSTVVLKALLKFLEKGGLHLAQEFVWYNSARLPSPIQWVNVERIRVKDSFTRIWWMSLTDRPKADNRKILREYSSSMKRLIASGKYNAGARPSQHQIGKKSFKTNNQGSIPPNVIDGDSSMSLKSLLNGESDERQLNFNSFLKQANTHSSDDYQTFCRLNNIPLHPARMPPELVEFFVRFLTDEGDMVLDPFGGSNTTGAQSEALGRKWISIEANWQYAASSIARFRPEKIKSVNPAISIRPRQAESSASSVLRPVLIS